MSSASSTISELEVLTKLQCILNEGPFVASYKYALLISLAELSVEKEAASDGTLCIEPSELAERLLAAGRAIWRAEPTRNERSAPRRTSRIRTGAKRSAGGP